MIFDVPRIPPPAYGGGDMIASSIRTSGVGIVVNSHESLIHVLWQSRKELGPRVCGRAFREIAQLVRGHSTKVGNGRPKSLILI
jgi:hypothetical protein